MKKSSLLFLSIMFATGAAYASNDFDATSYEVMQNCLADAESMPGSNDYIQYCIDSYLSTQQINSD